MHLNLNAACWMRIVSCWNVYTFAREGPREVALFLILLVIFLASSILSMHPFLSLSLPPSSQLMEKKSGK